MWGVKTPDSCRNFRPSELPTHVRTPNPQGIWKLAVGLWLSIPDTSGMTRTVNHLSQLSATRQNSRPLSELLTVGTSNSSQNSRRTNLRTTILPLLGKYRTRPVLIPDTSGIARPAKIKVSSFDAQILKTHMGWLEHLWNNIYQHDASLLIVRYSY